MARRVGKEGGVWRAAVTENSNGREPVSVARHTATWQPGWHPAGTKTQTMAAGTDMQVKGRGVPSMGLVVPWVSRGRTSRVEVRFAEDRAEHNALQGRGWV